MWESIPQYKLDKMKHDFTYIRKETQQYWDYLPYQDDILCYLVIGGFKWVYYIKYKIHDDDTESIIDLKIYKRETWEEHEYDKYSHGDFNIDACTCVRDICLYEEGTLE